MKFDNNAEELFYDFLVDYELTSMIKNIEGQVWVKTFKGRRRIDMVLTLVNDNKIYLELDGEQHYTEGGKYNDAVRDYDLKSIGIEIFRIKFEDFFKDRELIANKLEGLINLLSGDD